VDNSEKPFQRDNGSQDNSSGEMLFTGERIIPGKVDHDLYSEHLVRYLWAQQFCKGKRALDTGCGVGYGSFYLAQKADNVVGVDISYAAVSYALQHYSLPNVDFVAADCYCLPFPAKSFDVVTSFELIEHLQDPKTYMSEVRRVLRRDGFFIVSTPNRPVYAQHRGERPNPFHVREYDLSEFLLLLSHYFPYVQSLGEVHVPAVGVFSYPIGAGIACEALQSGSPDASDYFVCVCSQTEIKKVKGFVLIPSTANVLRERELHIRSLSKEVSEQTKTIERLQGEFDEKAAWADQLNARVRDQEKTIEEQRQHIRSLSAELAERESYVGRLQKEFDEKAAWTERLNTQVQEQLGRIAQLQREHDEKAVWAERLGSELQAERARVLQYQRDLGDAQKQLEDRQGTIENLQKVTEGLKKTTEEQRQRIDTLTWLWQRSTRTKRRLLCALAPLDWFIGLLVTATELLGRCIRKLAPRRSPGWPLPDTTRCSVIVLSWDGKELLAESLPAVLKALEQDGGDHEIIVVDNGSTDGTEEFVRRNFPTVRVVRSPRNIFFSRANNLGVQAATRDIVVLLNNDMIVDPGFLAPLLAAFKQPDVFSVASQVFFQDPTKRREETGKTRGYFTGGELVLSHDDILPIDEKLGLVPALYAGGGAAAFDRRKYLWLDGLDSLWDPFYYEDTDLSFRAWKTGWRCSLAVNSHVLHKHRATNTPRYGRAFVDNTVRRNSYLFLWKNLSSLPLLWGHFWAIAAVRVRRAGEPGVGIRFELRAYLRALRRLPLALAHRLVASRSFVRSDEEVFELASSPPEDLILASEIDFRKGPFQEYLGTGWHKLETDNVGGYRWIAPKAAAYLRAPASAETDFTIEGYIPPLARYDASKLHLSVRIGNESRVFTLVEGVSSLTWRVKGLRPDSVQRVELAADQFIRQTTDSRRLAVLVRRLGLKPSPLDNFKKALLATREKTPGEGAPSLGRKTKRILFVSAFAPAPNTHAGGQRVLRIIAGLSRFHEITLLTFLEEEKERERLSPVREYCRDVIPILRPRFPYAYDPWGIKPRWLEIEYNCPEMRELVKEAAFSGRFDLLQFEFLQMSKFLPERSPTPMLLTHHEIQALSLERKLSQLPRLSTQRVKLSRLWMQTLRYELTHLPRFRRVIVLTEEERVYLQRFLPSLPLVVNTLGVDCSFFQPLHVPEEPNSLVFVGYFKHEPNVDAADWLINGIMPKVARRFPDVRLYLVGNEPPAGIEGRLKGLDIRLTGWVPDIRPYLGRCAVFVAPIRLGAGMRGKVLEAWAMGRPIVCTTVACAGIEARHEENLLIANDEDAFADQVCRLLGDATLRERLGRAGLETARAHYDWEQIVQQHNAIYESI
jgi:GT2 family glycosyltransferase/glycosyltransferase involved in cell wall biosynthesis/SAM-dependent methyltransferase